MNTFSIKTDSVFCDHAVFQRGKSVWVTGCATESVTLCFDGKTYEGAVQNGRFCVEIPPQDAGGPYEMELRAGQDSVVLHDIMFGDVFLLAGQSNAELPLNQTDWSSEQYVYDKNVRIYYAGQHFSEQFHYVSPLDNRWNILDPSMGAVCPAIAYHLGQRLQKERNVAVGFVCVVKGAAVIQSFMSEKAAAPFAMDRSLLHSDHYSTDRYAFINRPGVIYHAMFQRILPYVVSYAVWYQGESNTSEAEGAVYDKMLADMVSEWRADLHNPTLPFAIIKLPPLRKQPGWIAVQEAQMRAARAIPYTTLVDIDDLNEDVIHPRNKYEVSERIYQTCFQEKERKDSSYGRNNGNR